MKSLRKVKGKKAAPLFKKMLCCWYQGEKEINKGLASDHLSVSCASFILGNRKDYLLGWGLLSSAASTIKGTYGGSWWWIMVVMPWAKRQSKVTVPAGAAKTPQAAHSEMHGA